MLDRSFAKARTWGQLGRWTLVLALMACSKKAPLAAADDGPDAGPGVDAKDAVARVSDVKGGDTASRQSACRAPGKGTSFTLGTEGERSESTDLDGGMEEDQPFAVALGNAVVTDGAFWVTAIDQRRSETHAVLAQVASSVDRGTVLDLGRVYGDAEPPRIALLGERAIVAVPDADASGRVAKIGLVSSGSVAVEWVDTVAQGADDSPVFSLSTQGSTALLAWDDIESSRRGCVRWTALATQAAPKKERPSKGKSTSVASRRNIQQSASDIDAEAPQLVTRPGGFWLGYLSSEVSVAKAKAKALSTKTKEQGPESTEDRAFVELGKRGIELLPLDLQGAVSGRSIVVTEPGAHVEAFEMKALPDGGVIAVYREARGAVGVEEDEATLVEVRPDGSVSRLSVVDERVGVGVPLLLVETAAGAPAKTPTSVWIGIAGKSGDMSVLTYRAGAGKVGEFFVEPLLVGAEPVARDGQALLVGRPRGRVVEFERIECAFDAKTLAPPAAKGN